MSFLWRSFLGLRTQRVSPGTYIIKAPLSVQPSNIKLNILSRNMKTSEIHSVCITMAAKTTKIKKKLKITKGPNTRKCFFYCTVIQNTSGFFIRKYFTVLFFLANECVI